MGSTPEFRVIQGVVLVILLGIAFAAGYFTRDHMSRKKRAQARRWRDYVEPDWLHAGPPANTNEVTVTNQMPQPAPATGELGQMLGRWENRARARRTA
ncbi:hypothetical protein ABIA96_002847 [Bradyrhizobium sp. LB11.1]|jgi:hypothetical protein